MSKGSVRLAQREDTPALVALMTEFYAEAGFALSDDAARRAFTILLNDPLLGHAWLIEEEAEGVGYVVLTFAFSMEFGGFRGFVDDFFVRPPARGRGLGAAALEEDRRRVDIAITQEGLGLLAEMDQATEEMNRRTAKALTSEEARTLTQLLERLRERLGVANMS